MRGVTWTEARHLLDLPDKLWASMARVDLFNIPAENISTLQASDLEFAGGSQQRLRKLT